MMRTCIEYHPPHWEKEIIMKRNMTDFWRGQAKKVLRSAEHCDRMLGHGVNRTENTACLHLLASRATRYLELCPNSPATRDMAERTLFIASLWK